MDKLQFLILITYKRRADTGGVTRRQLLQGAASSNYIMTNKHKRNNDKVDGMSQ